jgi:hypothetical protein
MTSFLIDFSAVKTKSKFIRQTPEFKSHIKMYDSILHLVELENFCAEEGDLLVLSLVSWHRGGKVYCH